MNQDPVNVNRIDWFAAIPALHLLKALRFAYRLRTLAPAVCAVVLVGLLLVGLGHPMASVFSMDHSASDLRNDASVIDFAFSPGNPEQVLLSVGWRLMTPRGLPIGSLIVIGILAQAIVVALGIGISRAATSEFCVQQRSGAWRNLKLSLRHSASSFAVAVVFFVFCAIAMLPVLSVRAYSSLAGNEELLRSAWPVVALLAIPAILMWTLIILAGPLTTAALATDDCGVADAMSRAFCYVLSHKLVVVLLLIASTSLAWICSSLAENLCSLSIGIAAHGLPENVTELKSTFWGTQQSESIVLTILVKVIATSVQFAVWQSSFAIGYVLLRKKEDATPYREISR